MNSKNLARWRFIQSRSFGYWILIAIALFPVGSEEVVWLGLSGSACNAQGQATSGKNEKKALGSAIAPAPKSGDLGSDEQAGASRILNSPPELFQGDATLPDAIYLRDEKNRSIFVPKSKYEDFEAYLRERSGAKISNLPVALLEGLTIDGKVKDGVAELKLQFTMSVTDPTAKIVQVPLGLQKLNWTKAAVGIGGRRNLVIAKEESEGAVWVVEPDGSEKYRLDMEAVLRVDTTFSESSLRFSLPECSTLIKIDLPSSEFDVEWIGSSGEVLEKEKVSGKTRAIVRGRGAGRLVWRDHPNAGGLNIFELDSYTRLTILSNDATIRATTRMRFSSTDRNGSREFTLRLPSQAKWVPGTSLVSNSNWSLRRLESIGPSIELVDKKQENANGTSTGDILKLQFANSGTGFYDDVEVQWVAKLPNIETGQFAISGIQVDEVQRHDAKLTISVPDTRRFAWAPQPDFELTAQSPSSANPSEIEYEFRCSKQNAILTGFVGTKENQSRWRPDYRIRFSRSEIELEGVISFNTDHRALAGLEIFGGEWSIGSLIDDKTSQVVPTEFVDSHTIRIPSDSDWILESPIRDFKVAGAPIVLSFSAVQPYPKGDRLNLQLPKLKLPFGKQRELKRGDGIVVFERDGWQFATEDVRTTGMIKTTEIPNNLRQYLNSTSTDELIGFRFQSAGPDPKWTGKLRRIPQTVSVTANTQLDISSNYCKIIREWSIETLGSPIENLPIRVPPNWIELDESSGNEVLVDSVAILDGTTRLNARVLPRRDGDWAYIEPLRESWPKKFRLVISGQQPLAASETAVDSLQFQSVEILLPRLELGTDVLFYANETSLKVGPGIVCRVDQDKLAPLFCTTDDRMVSIKVGAANDNVALGIMRLHSATEANVDIETVWLQTVVNQNQRRDRCLMKIRSNKDALQVKLPPDWQLDTMKVFLDGKAAVTQAVEAEDAIWLKLFEGTDATKKSSVDSTQRNGTHLLEFFSWSECQSAWYRKLEPVFPSIAGVESPFPFDWQVVTSADDCLWSRSSALLPERRWNWSNLAWSSPVTNAQKFFEEKFEASPQPPLPEYSNEYLFKSVWSSTVSQDRWLTSIALVPRYVLWFPVAICALLLTSLWPRIGVLQHPWFMLFAAVALGILSMWAPDMVVVLIQSALASLLLVFAVKSMQWALRQRGYRRSVFAGRAAPVTQRSVQSDESNRGKSKANVSLDVLISPTTNTMQNLSPGVPSEST